MGARTGTPVDREGEQHGAPVDWKMGASTGTPVDRDSAPHRSPVHWTMAALTGMPDDTEGKVQDDSYQEAQLDDS